MWYVRHPETSQPKFLSGGLGWGSQPSGYDIDSVFQFAPEKKLQKIRLFRTHTALLSRQGAFRFTNLQPQECDSDFPSPCQSSEAWVRVRIFARCLGGAMWSVGSQQSNRHRGPVGVGKGFLLQGPRITLPLFTGHREETGSDGRTCTYQTAEREPIRAVWDFVVKQGQALTWGQAICLSFRFHK